MRNATRVLLGAALIAAFASGAKAADRAGVGFEWAAGPTIPLGNFTMKINNEFSLGWKVSENITAEVFSSQGVFSGNHSYTNDTINPTRTEKVTVDGTTDISGIRIRSSIPGLDFFTLGLELGQQAMTTNGGGSSSWTYENSDGSAATAGEFGFTTDPNTLGATTTMSNLLGVNGKLVLAKGETKTVSGELSVGASLRFVDFGTRSFLFGTQEVDKTQPKAIDPVSGYNNLAITAGIGLWF